MEDLLDPRRRRRARAQMKARAGERAAGLLRRLQREQVNLAMIRAKVARDDDPALAEQRDLCRSLRDALMAMPGAAPAEPTGLGRVPVPADRAPPSESDGG
jgi:hypothetical protein